MAQMPEYVIKINADGEDMAEAPTLLQVLTRQMYRLQDEMHAYAEQLVAVKAELAEVRQRVQAWEADS